MVSQVLLQSLFILASFVTRCLGEIYSSTQNKKRTGHPLPFRLNNECSLRRFASKSQGVNDCLARAILCVLREVRKGLVIFLNAQQCSEAAVEGAFSGKRPPELPCDTQHRMYARNPSRYHGNCAQEVSFNKGGTRVFKF